MNIRKMKLALTVDLLNLSSSYIPLDSVQDSMSRFRSETGSYQGCKELESTFLQNGIQRKSVALQFENVTLDLDLITNVNSHEQLIEGFDLKENFA